jgi:hypothetical protein
MTPFLEPTTNHLPSGEIATALAFTSSVTLFFYLSSLLIKDIEETNFLFERLQHLSVASSEQVNI